MSLGANDALGIPYNKGSVFPTRIKLVNPASSTVGTVTYGTLVVNQTNGQMEWVKDPYWGDRIVIKQAGLYSIRSAIRMDTTSVSSCIARSLPPAFWQLAPTTLDDPGNNTSQYILAYTLNPAANSVLPITAVVWLDAGDYIQVCASTTVSTNNGPNQGLWIEKLGG